MKIPRPDQIPRPVVYDASLATYHSSFTLRARFEVRFFEITDLGTTARYFKQI